MNQEQNNFNQNSFNQNNFNTQNNNGISSTPPLNNQNMGINQPVVNAQTQLTPNYQPLTNTANIQNSEPQPVNQGGNTNVVQQHSNNKPKSKMKFGLIAAASIAAIVATGLIVFPKIFSNKNIDDNSENSYTDSIKIGNVEFIMASDKSITAYDEYYSTTNDEGETIIFDKKGKQLLPIPNYPHHLKSPYYWRYLGDGYFIYDTSISGVGHTAVVVKDGKLVLELNSFINVDNFLSSANFSRVTYYKNGIIYTRLDYENVIAYDIKNKKELWRAEGVLPDRGSGYKLDENFIRLDHTKNRVGDLEGFVKDPIPNTIIDYSGKKIVSGADIEIIEEDGEKKFKSQIWTSRADTYLEVKENDYIKIYDLNNNLKSTISLKESITTKYEFKNVLYSGIFIVQVTDKIDKTKSHKVIYNGNGEVVLTAGYIEVKSWPKIMWQPYELNKNQDIVSVSNYNNSNESVCALIQDGKVIAEYKSCQDAYSSYGKRHTYLVYEEKNESSDNTEGHACRILNLNTMKTTEDSIPCTTYETKIVGQSVNGEYLIREINDKYFVYDSEFNLKYESDYALLPVNNKYVISTKKYTQYYQEDDVIQLINIETGTATTLDVKGKYNDHSSQGLVTHDGTNYYAYSFK